MASGTSILMNSVQTLLLNSVTVTGMIICCGQVQVLCLCLLVCFSFCPCLLVCFSFYHSIFACTPGYSLK